MPNSIQAHRVFIASPGGLQDVREAFREILNEYNESEAIHRGCLFIPVGWELTLGGIGRPQSLINEDIRKCDLFLLVLWHRWGSPPDTMSSHYSSGTEEEFHVALECLHDSNHPMRQIVIFFKAVDPQQLSDPGAQLQKVLNFKKRLEEEKQYLYHTFDVLSVFRNLLRRHLGQWLREYETNSMGKVAGYPFTYQLAETEVHDLLGGEEQEKEESNTKLIREARQLEREGKLTEAEAAYARAIVRGDDPSAFAKYGMFLRRGGRFAQAEAMFERALELAIRAREESITALAYRNLSLVYKDIGNLKRAEEMQRSALEIYERLGDTQGSAAASSNLGGILSLQGDFDAAMEILEKALELNQQLDRQIGVARTYGNLGNLLVNKGDLAGAAEMHGKALELGESLGDDDIVATANFNIGLSLQRRGDLPGAEEAYRKAIETNEKMGRRYMVGKNAQALGRVLLMRGKFDGAEAMQRKALDISESLGDNNGIAGAYINLGEILSSKNKLEDAETMFRRASDNYEKMGKTKEIAWIYNRLAKILTAQMKLDEAHEFSAKAEEILLREDFQQSLIDGHTATNGTIDSSKSSKLTIRK